MLSLFLFGDADHDDQDKEQDAQSQRDIGNDLFRSSFFDILKQTEIIAAGKSSQSARFAALQQRYDDQQDCNDQ